MSANTNDSTRAGLQAIGGAVLVTVVATVGSFAFLSWRAHAELDILSRRGDDCAHGKPAACDLLRSACLKRNADSCVSLADAALAQGPRHDGREGVRLLGDACEYGHRQACYRAGTMLAAGTDVPKDAALAKRFLERGCQLGEARACAGGAAPGR